MKDLQDLLDQYVMDQDNWELNLKLAETYIKYGQLSAAFTHYMKAVEAVDESNYAVRYHCLMMISWIYKTEGCRWLGALQYSRFAKAECPDRPEAYKQLCDIWISKLNYDGVQEQGEWIQVYENARIGLMYSKIKQVPKSLYYEGNEYLEVYYALSLLKLGKLMELKKYLDETKFDTRNIELMNTVLYIYNELRKWCPYISYDKDRKDNLKLPFEGVDKIEKNYSQVMQDMFVLTALNGKTDGKYLEIGSADPIYGSNTMLLEQLGWDGLSMDIMINFVYQFNQKRKNTCYCLDALNTNYREVLKDKFRDETVLDYLSLDIDPADNTLRCLNMIPFDTYKFRVITFEHDMYNAGPNVMNQQRQYLSSLGYELIGDCIKCNCKDSFEDWWVHRDLVSQDMITKLKDLVKDSNGIVYKIFYK